MVTQFIPANSLREDWKLEDLSAWLQQILMINLSSEELLLIEGDEQAIIAELVKKFEVIHQYKLDKCGKNYMHAISKHFLILSLDQLWKEHLHSLDHLRQGINLRSFGQKDPLMEYKNEAYNLFEKMLSSLRENYIQKICYFHEVHETEEHIIDALKNRKMQEMHISRADPALDKYNEGGASITIKAKPFKSRIATEDRDPNNVETWGKISRNELCPCESGKKYKHCHGKEG
jgi:preprotein translocase subunit SecA